MTAALLDCSQDRQLQGNGTMPLFQIDEHEELSQEARLKEAIEVARSDIQHQKEMREKLASACRSLRMAIHSLMEMKQKLVHSSSAEPLNLPSLESFLDGMDLSILERGPKYGQLVCGSNPRGRKGRSNQSSSEGRVSGIGGSKTAAAGSNSNSNKKRTPQTRPQPKKQQADSAEMEDETVATENLKSTKEPPAADRRLNNRKSKNAQTLHDAQIARPPLKSNATFSSSSGTKAELPPKPDESAELILRKELREATKIEDFRAVYTKAKSVGLKHEMYLAERKLQQFEAPQSSHGADASL